jgi:hypothetical protein
VTPASDIGSDDIDMLRAALVAEQLARREAEARASGAEAMVAHLKLMIAKLRHEQYGASSERGRKLLDQMELELEELEASAAEDAAAVPHSDTGGTTSMRSRVGSPCVVLCWRISIRFRVAALARTCWQWCWTASSQTICR